MFPNHHTGENLLDFPKPSDFAYVYSQIRSILVTGHKKSGEHQNLLLAFAALYGYKQTIRDELTLVTVNQCLPVSFY